eukprot:7031626-Lingulodinium_polyedra.AAC.1
MENALRGSTWARARAPFNSTQCPPPGPATDAASARKTGPQRAPKGDRIRLRQCPRPRRCPA